MNIIKLKYVDYKKHHPATISFMPPAHEMDKWRADYKEMVTNFIYDDNKLNIDDLIIIIKILTKTL